MRKRYKIGMIWIVICVSFLMIVLKTNEMIEPRLLAISKQKTNDALKLLSHEVLSSLSFENKNLVEYTFNGKGEIISVAYNTSVLNDILEECLSTLQASLNAAQKGEKDPLLQEVFFKDGIVYEVPIGYLTGIAFLQNYGARLKIEMPLYHYVSGNLKIESEPYGINYSLICILININLLICI